MILLILLTSAMMGLAVWQRRARSLRWLTPLLWVVAILTITAALWRLHHESSPRVVDGQLTVATRLGEAVAADFVAPGEILVLQMPADLVGHAPFHESQLAGLRQALRGRALRLVGLENRPELSNAWARVFDGAKMDAELVGAYLRAHSGAVAVVSFEGLPGCAPNELPHRIPPFYAVGNEYDRANTDWQDSGLVKLLITDIIR